MAYSPIETIAIIFLALGVIKIAYLIVKPTAWLNFGKKIYAKPKALQFVAFILAAIIFYHLIQVFTIVEIFAVMAFMAMLMLVGMADVAEKMLKGFKIKTMWRDYWLYSLIWVVLMAWAIKELFF